MSFDKPDETFDIYYMKNKFSKEKLTVEQGIKLVEDRIIELKKEKDRATDMVQKRKIDGLLLVNERMLHVLTGGKIQ